MAEVLTDFTIRRLSPVVRHLQCVIHAPDHPHAGKIMIRNVTMNQIIADTLLTTTAPTFIFKVKSF